MVELRAKPDMCLDAAVLLINVMDRCHSLYRPAHTKQSIHECKAIGCNQIAQQVKRGRGRGGGRSIRAGTIPL